MQYEVVIQLLHFTYFSRSFCILRFSKEHRGLHFSVVFYPLNYEYLGFSYLARTGCWQRNGMRWVTFVTVEMKKPQTSLRDEREFDWGNCVWVVEKRESRALRCLIATWHTIKFSSWPPQNKQSAPVVSLYSVPHATSQPENIPPIIRPLNW